MNCALLTCLHLLLAATFIAANAQYLTVSGQSAGGSMAMQHLFAFSAQVKGAAIAAGSPYGCGAFAEGHDDKKGNWSGTCYWGGTNVTKTVEYVQQRFKDGLIDDPANLKSTPINIFNGHADWTVYTAVSRDIVRQLREFVNHGAIETQFNTEAAHVWPLDHFPFGNHQCTCGKCAFWGSYSSPCCDFNNCGYDLSGKILRRSYGKLKPRVQAHRMFTWINQWSYMPPKTKRWSALLDHWAVAYIPTSCKDDTTACSIHVNYHGCINDVWHRRKMWINGLDLNEYGEANDIIILYPQARGNRKTGTGCWNWGFPHLDKLFDTKESVQLKTVMNMVGHFQQGSLHDFVQLPLHIGPPASEDDHPSDGTESVVAIV